MINDTSSAEIILSPPNVIITDKLIYVSVRIHPDPHSYTKEINFRNSHQLNGRPSTLLEQQIYPNCSLIINEYDTTIGKLLISFNISTHNKCGHLQNYSIIMKRMTKSPYYYCLVEHLQPTAEHIQIDGIGVPGTKLTLAIERIASIISEREVYISPFNLDLFSLLPLELRARILFPSCQVPLSKEYKPIIDNCMLILSRIMPLIFCIQCRKVHSHKYRCIDTFRRYAIMNMGIL
jgi:hypothetical protein